jgi:ABC-2 type transport system ATP-binding protein
MTPAIRTRGLSKDYSRGRGLFDLNLEVEEGEALGYLGPNGAGKTTTIRLLMGLIHPTAGSATIFGLDCQRQAVEVKRRVGYISGELPQFGGLRGSEIVVYLGGLRGGVDGKRVKSLAERFDLDLGRPFREYSHGNKQKLAIVLGFMHRPELLFLDEPTTGLDPLNQQEFYRLLKEVRADGATIFLSSHILSEVEHVCDRVGILRSGSLVRVAGLDELHHIRVHDVEIEFADQPPVARLQAIGLDHLQVDGPHVRFTLRGQFEPLMAAIAGARVIDFVSREPSLEEIFLAYYQDGEPTAAAR